MNGTPEIMDPERLKELRESLTGCDPDFGYPLQSFARELLKAHDFFRNRADVNGSDGSDVKSAGVTVEKCEAWLTQNGWFLVSHPDNKVNHVWEKTGEREYANIWLDSLRPLMCVAVIINLRARDAKRPAFDILEEMAAL